MNLYEQKHVMNEIKEKNMRSYLIDKFCHDEYERVEMKKWIDRTSIKFVYDFILKHFKTSTSQDI